LKLKLILSQPGRSFWHQDADTVAREVLGKVIIQKTGSTYIAGIITETESYHGWDDDACHAFKGRTNRTRVIIDTVGHYYIYLIYGMHFMLNFTCYKEGFPSAVLVRGVQLLDVSIKEADILINQKNPVELWRVRVNLSQITCHNLFLVLSTPAVAITGYNTNTRSAMQFLHTLMLLSKNKKLINLTNGPGKITKKLKINKDINDLPVDLRNGPGVFENPEMNKLIKNNTSITATRRIGIEYAVNSKEWKKRFLLNFKEQA